MPEVTPSEPAVEVPVPLPSVVLVVVSVVLVVLSVISVTEGLPHDPVDLQPVSDRTMLLPPVPAVAAVNVSGLAPVPGVTVVFGPARFLKQVPPLVVPHWAELFSMAARKFFAVFVWPVAPEPASSTWLAGELPDSDPWIEYVMVPIVSV